LTALLPLMILLSSLIPSLATFFLREESVRLRNGLSLGGAVVKLGLIAIMLTEVTRGAIYETRFEFAPGLYLLLRVDALSLLFVTLSAFLWLLTTIYAIAYFGTSPNLSRFFGFFSLCVAATTGIALSGTLITFFVFYELLTLSTWPLVVHKGDAKSLRAGRRYLAYTMPGAAFLLDRDRLAREHDGADRVRRRRPLRASTTGACGRSSRSSSPASASRRRWCRCTAGCPPPWPRPRRSARSCMRSPWSRPAPSASCASSTTSSAPPSSHELGVGVPLALLASFTILYGSAARPAADRHQARLAFSTVSQVSYIVLGTALAGPFATIGGLVHLVHQGLMKITLFFCAGSCRSAETSTGSTSSTASARACPGPARFSIGALGMIGVPPIAGFVSKWYLGIGALQAGQPWVIWCWPGSRCSTPPTSCRSLSHVVQDGV
jgi:multicomponent Na+:H+ antiporter subunit D